VVVSAMGAFIGAAHFLPAVPDEPLLYLPIEHETSKIEVKKPPPPPVGPVVFETPPGGIVPADLSPAEKAALAANPPPPPTIAEQVAPPVAPPSLEGGPKVANPTLLEKTADGYIPRISETGLWPLHAYAGAVPPIGNRSRIAIVISGLGISAKATQAAIDNLPPAVTLAFAPYANDVQHWVILARQKGHEVLLQVPMEPFDFPDSDPGQYTLRSAVGEEGNVKRLTWSLSRMTGYVGISNLLGGRFLSDSGAVEPLLTYLMRHGLMFFDNGSANKSVAKDVASRLGSPFVQATNTIDSIQASMEIDHRLADLEAEARNKGFATGSGSLYPVTIERVNQWARGLPGRGFVLVPVSAIVAPEKK
jgi:polysaccharide deacetylase 2 family uncharacterized protein YibQ